MVDALILIVGFLILIKGADWFVQSCASIASRFGISPFVVGLTIVSFGTSLPELFVTMVSGLRSNADLAIANVIGSNIVNVLLVLGIAAIIRPLPVHDATVVSEIPFSFTAAILVGFLANAALFSDDPHLTISRLDGFILLFFFFFFMLYVYKMSSAEKTPDEQPSDRLTAARTGVYALLGIAGMYFGGQWVVDGAVALAQLMGVDDALIGLTIVAIGTSAPELVASAVAAYRGHTDIAVGNVVGSNIFNLLWILGLTASIAELPFSVVTNTDLAMVITSSSLIILALATSRGQTVTRLHGIIFVTLYMVYLFYLVQR